MIQQKTVFVIGAGAHCEIGMPLGTQLCDQISSDLNIMFRAGSEQISGSREIMDAIRIIAEQRKTNPNVYRSAGVNVAKGIVYAQSIDSYLDAHTGNDEITICGKLAIVSAIAQSEGTSAVSIHWPEQEARFRNQAMVNNSWMRTFMYVLSQGIRKHENLSTIFQNVQIISFNYDRCLEQFLWLALQQLYLISEDEASDLMATLEIIHPYGWLGPLGWQSRQFVSLGEKLSGDKLLKSAERIRTFSEQIDDPSLKSKMSRWLSEVDQVIFLGFHFHDPNMTLLLAGEADDDRRPVWALGTVPGRSLPDKELIAEAIKTALRPRSSAVVETLEGVDCHALLKQYASTIMR